MSLNVVEALFSVGIDWAAASHAVCVLDSDGRKVAAFTVEHSSAGFTDLVRRLSRLAAVTGSRSGSSARTAVWSIPCCTLKSLAKTITATLGQHPDGKTFTSLPRSAQINAAQMLAE